PDLAGVAPDACSAHGAAASSYGFHIFFSMPETESIGPSCSHPPCSPGRAAAARLDGGAILTSALLIATLRLRHSLALHLFADMHNLLSVPNKPKVLTAYPLLLVGVPGLILCLCGSECLGVS
ncbi:unnamed protein product, partial [Urochloa humidicola]